MEVAPTQELSQPEPLHFRQEVTIKGLPYIFEGDIPQQPANFKWSVSVPDWERQKVGVEERIKKGEINPNIEDHLTMYDLGGGRVGILHIKRVDPKDNAFSVGISLIASHTTELSEGLGYHKAKRIGSFLLDNLCALADIKGWRIYLEPSDRGWGLSQMQLINWYRRKGFDFNYKFAKESRDTFGLMQREPKEPDKTQVVAGILGN